MPDAPSPTVGGLTLKDARPHLCTVVDNGIAPDDPRVLLRLNQATKIILDEMIPVGGMATYNVQAQVINGKSILLLPPQLENCIEAVPSLGVKVRGNDDIAQSWYEIVTPSTFLDPAQHHDNPVIDLGLVIDPNDPKVLRRKYEYPGLEPQDATVSITGARRYLPLWREDDSLIVQNLEALKCIILSIERYENNDPDGAIKYRQMGMDILNKEVKKHIMDPRNYMRRKSAYQDDLIKFPENTLGWMRANIALDVEDALKTGKMDLTWTINQAERRIMQRIHAKDTIVEIQARVTGGIVYFPLNVGSVLEVDLCGRHIPVRSKHFQYLENGPGFNSCAEMLVDKGDEYFPGTKKTRRKYWLNARCEDEQVLTALCKLRWLYKQPNDLMVIKNYEAIRLMVTAKFLEEKENWDMAQKNKEEAFGLLQAELNDFLSGIKHTVHVQTYGFGLNTVGGSRYWS